MAHSYSGTFTVIDGLDGVGKGVVIEGIVEDLRRQGARVFSLDQWWMCNHFLPEFNYDNLANRHAYHPLDSFDVLISSEPTSGQIGQAIREEVIRTNGREYSARTTAQLYALDRLSLHRRVLLPALEAGRHVVQSRSVSTSIVYQSTQKLAEGEAPLSMEEIMSMEGNKFCLENGPNLLIIPTIQDVQAVMDRLLAREKQDAAEFENLRFQMEIKPLYEGAILREIFERSGTTVKYIDAGVSIEESKRQAVEVFRDRFKTICF